MYYINYFFFMSIIGHIIEVVFHSNGDSGILLGYWTPIYGIGAIIILIVNKYVNKIKLNRFLKILTLFLVSSIILSLIEVWSGYLIKWLFNKDLWNYSNHKFNIGKYTSLEISILWGISSIILIYLLKPFIDKFISKIPKFLSYIFILIFIIDLIATLIIKAK